MQIHRSLEMEYGENEWLDDIQVQTKRLTGLTNDLIYLSTNGRRADQNFHDRVSVFRGNGRSGTIISESCEGQRKRFQGGYRTYDVTLKGR